MIPFTDNSAHIETDFCTQRRLEETVLFIRPDDMRGRLLDIGPRSFVTDKLVSHYGVFRRQNLSMDFTLATDFNIWIAAPGKDYDTVLFLEVFEHLMNPLKAVENIRGLLKTGGVMYISTPVHNPFGFYFNETCHFAEYKISSVLTLLKYAGFQVTDSKTFKSIPFWRGMKEGGGIFRTFLRVSSQETQIHRCVKL